MKTGEFICIVLLTIIICFEVSIRQTTIDSDRKLDKLQLSLDSLKTDTNNLFFYMNRAHKNNIK